MLPTYNGAKFISQAIRSVLDQSFSDWELIVVDDGSTDDTARIVQDFVAHDQRIIYVKNDQNYGIQRSLNNGLERARGEYIARLDDDDQWVDTHKLSQQVAFLDLHPDYVLVGTGAIVADEQGRELSRFLNPVDDKKIREIILGKNCFTHCSVMFRKDAALRFRGYSENRNVLHVEDYDLFLKLGTIGKLANLPVYGVRWMMGKSALSARYKMKQFWNDIWLTMRFAKRYPGFIRGFFRNWIRLLLYGVFRFIPFISLKYALLRLYTKLFRRAM